MKETIQRNEPDLWERFLNSGRVEDYLNYVSCFGDGGKRDTVSSHRKETVPMQEFIQVTGIILKQTPIGEYDRRICLLTKEKGKISAFVRGSRKPGSRLSSATNPFFLVYLSFMKEKVLIMYWKRIFRIILKT